MSQGLSYALTVLTTEQEKASAETAGSEFRECALACPLMVAIPAGKFTMGSSDNETGRTAGEGPQDETAITNAFAISKAEVTFEQRYACVAAAECPLALDAWGRGTMPVINVSWDRAKSNFSIRANVIGRQSHGSIKMSYKQESLAQQHRVTGDAIAALMPKYQPGQPTIVFLPGGLASALEVSDSAYAEDNQSYGFNDVWISSWLFRGKLVELGMAGVESLGGKLVRAPQALSIQGVDIYKPFEDWCAQHHYNLLTVAYDWRLRNSDSADLLAYALRKLDAAIVQKFGADEQVADHLCLVAHSLGGIALKLFLNGGGDFVERMRLAVTVGSPFYGYGGSLPWWFNGQSNLNAVASPGVLANLIASLPGPYMLPYLDLPTFRANESGFAADKDDPLLDYPLVTAGDANPIDPYTPPPPPPQRAWYPTWVNQAELQIACTQNRALAAPLPTAVAAKFHNFRGIQTTKDQIVVRGTVNGATWTPIDPDTFNPSDEANSPIQDKKGPGDDTIPAWSARLLTTPFQNVHTFKEPMEHMCMMANPSILATLQALIGPGATVVQPPPAFPPVSSVTSDEAREWLQKLISSPPPNLKTVFRNAAVPDGPARRIFADLLKR